MKKAEKTNPEPDFRDSSIHAKPTGFKRAQKTDQKFTRSKFWELPCTMIGIKRMRRQATDKEKIFAKVIPKIELLSKIHKELLKLNQKKMHNLIFKVGKRPEWTSHQR